MGKKAWLPLLAGQRPQLAEFLHIHTLWSGGKVAHVDLRRFGAPRGMAPWLPGARLLPLFLGGSGQLLPGFACLKRCLQCTEQLTPEALTGTPVEALRSAGLSERKVRLSQRGLQDGTSLRHANAHCAFPAWLKPMW